MESKQKVVSEAPVMDKVVKRKHDRGPSPMTNKKRQGKMRKRLVGYYESKNRKIMDNEGKQFGDKS